MRFRMETSMGAQPMMRVFGKGWGEIAYVIFGFTGPQAEIEFPSDWHEHRRAWVRLGLGIIKICFSFPWSKVVPDDGQCSGPTYGFHFFLRDLHVHWGKSLSDKMRYTIIRMPWGWRHKSRVRTGPDEAHPYRYVFNSGKVQERIATIYPEKTTLVRPWLPWKKVKHAINVEFNDEVGERSGSWKGGCIGCGYEILKGETPLDTLRRMERERRFT